ncbi:hypothetical protein DPEC_G00156820 [Dallia pectoralis]|uniref:Uncharacterized protein n=1 Tax=Dallia pectoralis TaxID=75939 RepID=A0ACC2GKT2_DALPE|nr:hypothetical protein DPEC_G00156820 [Dallia pectoralis]
MPLRLEQFKAAFSPEVLRQVKNELPPNRAQVPDEYPNIGEVFNKHCHAMIVQFSKFLVPHTPRLGCTASHDLNGRPWRCISGTLWLQTSSNHPRIAVHPQSL